MENINFLHSHHNYESALLKFEESKNAFLNAIDEYHQSLKISYPLEKQLGKTAYYHRWNWGEFSSHRAFLLDNKNYAHYQYLKPHFRASGDVINQMIDCVKFDSKKQYMIYAIYDEFFKEDPEVKDFTPIQSWPLYEFLIVES